MALRRGASAAGVDAGHLSAQGREAVLRAGAGRLAAASMAASSLRDLVLTYEDPGSFYTYPVLPHLCPCLLRRVYGKCRRRLCCVVVKLAALLPWAEQAVDAGFGWSHSQARMRQTMQVGSREG